MMRMILTRPDIASIISVAKMSERERIIVLLREELKDSEEDMLGTKGGWREYLISLINKENHV